uniref:Zinc finger B-box domain containing n=1 Tax=Monodelphis domestica TaxID=13616 RepID=A0A5F8GDR5_MONDO
MNTNDFIVLPWGKSGNSVKLKAKNVRELRLEKVQLELETQEMEKKLQQLQSSMSREKEERERSSGFHWKSGQPGKLTNQSQAMSQNKENVAKISPGKVKLRILKDQIQELPKQSFSYKASNTCAQDKVKAKIKVCGQCENKYALLVCLECGEDYCSSCFARIHQKGALKRHRTTLLQVDPTASQKAELTNETGGLLLQGSFDEEESANSFQEILSQWRNSNQENKEKQVYQEAEISPGRDSFSQNSEQMEASEAQTNLKIWREPLKIEFKEDSLTYVERLWLKKHRRNLLHSAKSISPEKEISPSLPISEPPSPLIASTEEMELSEKHDIIEDEEIKPNNLAPCLPEQPELEKPDLAVKIEELDDNYEEEPGESGSSVPYKVELANTDCQQSWGMDEYQKTNFQFGKGIPFSLAKASHAVQRLENLTREKDLLSHCSNIISSSSKENLKVSSPRSSTPDISKITERMAAVSSEKHITKKKSFLLENRKPDEKICASHQRTLYHSNLDLGDSHSERSTYNCKVSLQEKSFQENNNSQRPRSSKPSKLQKIALRTKPVIEQYQGLEKFFIFGKNPFRERFKLSLAMRSESSLSNSRITLAGNRHWISENSLSEHADDSIVQDVIWNNQKKSLGVLKPQRGRPSQRPLSANIPLCKTVLYGSPSYMSLHERPRSAVSRPASRATSEISEIEYLDITDQNEPFLEDAADHQTLDSLERELNTLRNLSDAPERLYSLNPEKLSSINRHLEKIGKTMTDVPKTSELKDSSRLDISRDNEIHCHLSSSESSIDDEEENSLEKQQVIALH